MVYGSEKYLKPVRFLKFVWRFKPVTLVCQLTQDSVFLIIIKSATFH